MPQRIVDACLATGQRPPGTQPEIVRCILDSLAVTFAARVHDAARLSGQRIEVIHVVGGGSQNRLLCQLVADAAGLPVVAGPVEATALGNLLVQARTHGVLNGDLSDLRAQLRAATQTRTFEPHAASVPALAPRPAHP
jgi:rhamnulokinase